MIFKELKKTSEEEESLRGDSRRAVERCQSNLGSQNAAGQLLTDGAAQRKLTPHSLQRGKQEAEPCWKSLEDLRNCAVGHLGGQGERQG